MAVMMQPLLSVHQLWLQFIRLLANPLVIILLAASALSAATGDVASFIIIASIVLLSALLDFAQASQAQNAVDALRQQVALRADVRRQATGTIDNASPVQPRHQLSCFDFHRTRTAGLSGKFRLARTEQKTSVPVAGGAYNLFDLPESQDKRLERDCQLSGSLHPR
jgi:hypothetical protein